MTLLVQRILDGLADGSLYAALALALTIVYQGTGRLNLAQGELGTIGTYLGLVLATPAVGAVAGTGLARNWVPFHPWPLWLSIVAAMGLAALVGAGLERFVIRRVADRPVAASVRVTVAILILANAWLTMTWNRTRRSFPSLFPNGPKDFIPVAGARLRITTIGMWAMLLMVLGLLWLLSQRTRAGLAFRAVAQAPGASALAGIRAQRVWSGSWALAGAIGTLVGVLSAARLVLTPDMMVRLLVYGFVAAALGGFASPGGALLGGLAVGMGQSLLAGYTGYIGENLAFPMIVMVLILLLAVRPPVGAVSGEGAGTGLALRRRTEPGWRSAVVRSAEPTATWRRRLTWGSVALVVALVPAWWFPLVHARAWGQLVGATVAFAGLALILGPAGGLSLGHAAFMGLGAYTVGIAAGKFHMPTLVGVVVAGLVGAVAGGLVGFPALRIRGQYLAVVTFCVAVMLPSLINRFRWLTGGDNGPPLIKVPQGPAWFPAGHRSNTWFFLLSLVLAAVLLLLVHLLLGGPWGRALRASSDDPVAAASLGVPVARIRTAAFALATALAAMGGAMMAVPIQAVTGGVLDPFRSLAAFALVALCGVDSLAGALLAAILYVGTPWFLTTTGWALGARGVAPDDTGGGAYLLWGLALLVGTLLMPDGLVPALRRRLRGWWGASDDLWSVDGGSPAGSADPGDGLGDGFGPGDDTGLIIELT